MKVRYAKLEDSKHIFEWRNDEFNRSMSASGISIDWKEHTKWYKSALIDPDKVIVVGEDSVGKIGMVRIDYSEKRTQATISINLNPIRIGQRLSSDLLNESISYAKLPKDIRLIAQIRHQNIASIRCFYRCQFHYADSDDDFIYLAKWGSVHCAGR